ncbi:MAG TPA: hypothetical protein VGI36_08320 [Candidatus Binataceae bacterium]
MLDGRANSLRLARVPIFPATTHPVAQIAESISKFFPELGPGSLALVDSPRAPCVVRSESRQRDLDLMLRRVVAAINRARSSAEYLRLALFPTPAADYFARCASATACKPHLIRIAHELRLTDKGTMSVPRGRGWLFTRFMLAGFATHRALEQLGVDSFESYPYLVFSLWKAASERLPPKSDRRAALKARRAILARLTRSCRLTAPAAKSLDEADAAVLAVTAHLSAIGRGGALMFHSQMHGRFLLALRKRDLATALALGIVSLPPLGVVDGPAAREGSGGGRGFSPR